MMLVNNLVPLAVSYLALSMVVDFLFAINCHCQCGYFDINCCLVDNRAFKLLKYSIASQPHALTIVSPQACSLREYMAA